MRVASGHPAVLLGGASTAARYFCIPRLIFTCLLPLILAYLIPGSMYQYGHKYKVCVILIIVLKRSLCLNQNGVFGRHAPFCSLVLVQVFYEVFVPCILLEFRAVGCCFLVPGKIAVWFHLSQSIYIIVHVPGQVDNNSSSCCCIGLCLAPICARRKYPIGAVAATGIARLCGNIRNFMP